MVKFNVAKDKSSTITVEDKAIVSLKTLITDLNLQTEELTSQISRLSDAARNGVRLCNRSSAIRALRSRKLAEQALARKLDYLAQLEGTYDQIEQAVDQLAMIEAMKGTTQVLRGLRSEIGDVENVENVMEELHNEMLKSDEISNAIKGDQDANAVDEEAIEAELSLLLRNTDLNENEKQVQDVAARLDSIIPRRDSSTVPEIMGPNKNPTATTSTLVLPDRENLPMDEGHYPLT